MTHSSNSGLTVPWPAWPADQPSRLATAEPLSIVRRENVLRWSLILCCLCTLLWCASPVIGFVRVLAALTLIGYAGAALGIFLPGLGILSVATLCALDPLTRVFLMTGGLFRWNTFNYFLVLVSLSSFPLLLRLRDPHTRLMQVLILILLIGVFNSDEKSDCWQHIVNASSVFGLTVYTIRGHRLEAVWPSVGLLAGMLSAVGCLFFYVAQSSLPTIDKNAMSMFPVASLVGVTIGFQFSGRYPTLSLVLLVLAVINSAWVFLSASRGGMLIALCCVMCLLLSRFSWTRTAVFAGTVSIAVLASLTWFPDMAANSVFRVQKLLDADRKASTRTSGRSDLMRGGWRIFAENPFGVGTGDFGSQYAVVSASSTDLAFRRGKSRPSHSAWIKVLAENGLPGITVLACFVGSFAYRGWKSGRQTLQWTGLLTTGAISVAFLSTEFQSKALWFVAASAISILGDCRRSRLDRG
jgi:hypothetical protein